MGAILVVGSGQSGLSDRRGAATGGRAVYLAVSRCWWAPRRYRGRDVARWFRALGLFDESVDDLPSGARSGAPNPQLTGGDGGHDMTPYTLAREGVVLLGRVRDVRGGRVVLTPDLAETLAGRRRAVARLSAGDRRPHPRARTGRAA
jgi:putative flavoprotein involved in K+ transport